MATRSAASATFTNGRIYVPGALEHAPADWLVVDGGRVAAAGSGVPPASDAPSIDLRGRTLAPAFSDAHVHLTWLATALLGPDLSGCDSVAALLDAVAAWRGPGRGPDGAWIVGTGFDESPWRDKRLPTRAELDRIESRRPVLVQRVCGHVGVANSAALALATAAGGHTDRDTGRLAEDDLYELNDVVRPSADELAAVLPDVVALLHCHGITAVHDVSSPAMVHALSRCRGLSVRVTCSVPARYLTDRPAAADTAAGFFAAHDLEDLPLGDADSPFEVLGLKLFLDGSLGARTACLRLPYADAPASRGSCLYDSASLASLVRSAADAGLQLMVHAIGDAALDQALEVLAPLASSGNPLRHRIEHLEVTPRDLVARFASTGIWACVQPNFAGRWSQPGGMNEQRLGARLAHCNAFGTLRAAGIPLAFGSDCMPLGPAYGLHSAIAHPLASERLPRAVAWDLYTRASREITRRGAAAAVPMRQHDTTGSGDGDPDSARSVSDSARVPARVDADFVVLESDPFRANDWHRLPIAATIRRGAIVWSA